MAGATGLDYQGVAAVLELKRFEGEREDLFDALQLMERAALDEWSKQAERRK